MADALSVSPTVFTCLKKNLITSNNGTPSKPGKYQCLLLRKIKATGVWVIMIRSSLVIGKAVSLILIFFDDCYYCTVSVNF